MSGEGWKAEEMVYARAGVAGWGRALWRGLALGLVTYGGLVVLLLVRLVERPLFGLDRPWTPHITQFVCKAAFVILRLPVTVRGEPMQGRGAMVANHASWMDIFALNAAAQVYFVAKSEVAGWAGIGWLARATGTVFIARKGREAKVQQRLFEDRLRAGHRLAFFPEGTSTDGVRVLPFKSTLFAAFYTHGLDEVMQIQPVTLVYHAPRGQDSRFYGWWADMTFGGHFLRVLMQGRQGRVEVVFHKAAAVEDFPDRKALAAHCEAAVRAALVL
ncbi:lysophospholipid acyltransferase family protein [Paragemmobacter aquarius]|nr:lysophospholipid acyltransferase family protein [Gemmobacter aquarius]